VYKISVSFPQHGIMSVELIGWEQACREVYQRKEVLVYSRTPLIGINLDGEPSGCAENSDNLIFF
jgi:hypothetical protein